MDLSGLVKRFTDGFRGGADKAAFLVVVGGAALFVLYLVGDAIYHRMKWRRLRKKFKEAADFELPHGRG